MEALIVSLIFLLTFGALACGIYWVIKTVMNRGRELNILVQQGTTVTGQVKKLERIIRSRAGTDELYLTYQFQDARGQEHSKRLKVFSSQYADTSQGNPIEIVYLRERPEVSATNDMVQKMRDAMHKHRITKPGT